MPSHRLVPVPALADNYIWLMAEGRGSPGEAAGSSALIVDPGEAAPVFTAIEREQLVPSAILLTHHHPDHIGGVAALIARYPHLPVFAPHDPRIPTATKRVADGERISLEAPRVSFEVLAIPGHTLSHIAYFGAGIVFAGDTLFSVGCGRMFEGTPTQMLASLDRLSALPDSTLLCCGHEYTQANCAFALSVDSGNIDLQRRAGQVRDARKRGEATVPVTLALEHATNPFLRVDTPALREACSNALGAAAAQDRVARFAWLRREKDGFRA